MRLFLKLFHLLCDCVRPRAETHMQKKRPLFLFASLVMSNKIKETESLIKNIKNEFLLTPAFCFVFGGLAL